MPFSKLNIVIERIIIGSRDQNLQMLTSMFLKQSQKGFEVAKGDQVADICNGQQA